MRAWLANPKQATGLIHDNDEAGHELLSIAYPIPLLHSAIIIQQPQSEVYEALNAMRRQLILWTLVMCVWLYATRIPASKKHNIVYDPRRPAEEFHARLPAEVRWKADNYDNLLEQPTIFYAMALTLAFLDAGARPDR